MRTLRFSLQTTFQEFVSREDLTLVELLSSLIMDYSGSQSHRLFSNAHRSSLLHFILCDLDRRFLGHGLGVDLL